MTSPDGGFYTAFDADSLDDSIVHLDAEGERKPQKKEGAFYLWSADELTELLKQDFAWFAHLYNIQPDGNIRHDPHQEFGKKNIIHQVATWEDTAQKFKLTQEQLLKMIEGVKRKLYDKRAQRSQPLLDDKVLTDLNGMMISSFVLGYRVTNRQDYLDAAETSARFIQEHLRRKDGRLLHRYRAGESAIEGHLDDYAYTIQALLDLYQVTFNLGYLEQAHQLLGDMIRLFWDESGKSFYLTGHDADPLLLRPKETNDGAIPSGHSVAIYILLQMTQLTGQLDFRDMALDALTQLADDISHTPRQFAYALLALDRHLNAPQEIVLAGEFDTEESVAIKQYLQSVYLPSATFSQRPSSDEDAQAVIALMPYSARQKPIDERFTVFICENHVCKRPVFTLDDVKKILSYQK
jgi:uncharacterized protein YyaL (SSP411 family)